VSTAAGLATLIFSPRAAHRRLHGGRSLNERGRPGPRACGNYRSPVPIPLQSWANSLDPEPARRSAALGVRQFVLGPLRFSPDARDSLANNCTRVLAVTTPPPPAGDAHAGAG